MDEGSHGANVLTESADGDQMAGDPIELASNYPTEDLVSKHRRKIIGAIRIWHVAMPGDLLADLLNRPMEVANVWNRLADHFAIGLDHKAQHTVRAGVLRP